MGWDVKFNPQALLQSLKKRSGAKVKRGQNPRNGEDRRKDRKRALEWHRMAIRGVYTERRREIRRTEDKAKCRYDPWYTFYEFNPRLAAEQQTGSSRG